jgi:hypothetical protein
MQKPAKASSEITWGEIKRQATKEADEVAQSIRSKTLKFCQYVTQAFSIAESYARTSHVSPEKRNLNYGQFLSSYLRLVENLKRADKLLQTSPNLLDKWPQAPNTTFGPDAGSSALDVAYKFSQRVKNAVTIARVFTLGRGLGEKFFDEIVPSDKRVRAWLDAAIEELQTKNLPPLADWPIWQAHRDVTSLWHQLLAEQKKVEKPKSETPQGKRSRNISKRFTFNQARAYFDGKDLGLPTGAVLRPVEILKKLVQSFDRVVKYGVLVNDNSTNKASDFLRKKIRVINVALQKHKVPYKITHRQWEGYILTTSRAHF